MDDSEIKTLISRLSRPHPTGGVVIERAALLANGSDFPKLIDWITAHAGRPDAVPVASARGGGLHGARFSGQERNGASAPLRYVLPNGALD